MHYACSGLQIYRIAQDSLSSPKKRKSPSFPLLQRGMNGGFILATLKSNRWHDAEKRWRESRNNWMPDQVRHDIFLFLPCTLYPEP
jgi:hypothetical protein